MALGDIYANLLPAANAYLAPTAATIPPPDADGMAKLREFATTPAPPTVMGTHDSPPVPGAPPAGFSPALASKPLPPSAFQPPSAPPTITMPEQVISAPAAPAGPPPEPSAPAGPSVVMTPQRRVPGREEMAAGPTRIAMFNEATKQREQAVDAETAGHQKALLHQAITATVARDDANAQMHGAEQAMADQQQRLAEKQAKLQAFDAELAKNQPTDFWSDRSAGNRALIALSVALMSGGQTLAGGNPALGQQMLQSWIDNDLRTKQARFNTVVARRDNAQAQFDNLVHQIGLEPAKDMWQAALKEKLAAEAEMRAASTKLPEVIAQGEKMKLGLLADANQHRGDAFTKYVPPTTQGAQYMVDGIPIPVAGNKAFDYIAGQRKEAADQEGRERIEGIKLLGKGQEHKDTNTRFIAEKLQSAGIPQALSAIDKAESFLYDDPKTGRKAVTDGIGMLANGAWNKSKATRAAFAHLYGQDAVRRNQAIETAKGDALKALTGQGVTGADYERFERQADAANDLDSIRTFLTNVKEKLHAGRDSIYAGAGPEATEAYRQNLNSLKPQKIEEEPIQ